jgi:hypothetical protein
MPNVYIEARPKGRRQGDPIDDYVVEIAIMSSLHSRRRNRQSHGRANRATNR